MTEIRTYSTRDCVRVKFPTRAKMIKFPRKFKLPFDSRRWRRRNERYASFASRWPTIFNSGRTSDSIRGNEYSHFNGKRNNCTFCHFLQASPRWLIQRAGIWSVKSFDSLHGPAVTFAPHSSLTLARLAARETTYAPLPPPSLLLISLRFTEPSTRFHPHPNIHTQLARISLSSSIFYRCERKNEKHPFNFTSRNPEIKILPITTIINFPPNALVGILSEGVS